MAQTQTLAVQGVAVTGPNSLLGQQLVDFGTGVGPGNDLVAGFNPNGPQPLALTPSTPLDTVLATTSQPADVDQDLVNLPLRDVPANVGTAGETRETLPGQLSVGAFANNQAAPSGPITLGEWLEAEGNALFRCQDGENPTVAIRVRNLIPNRLFTVWAILEGADGAVPFGGAPNVIMTDEHGNGDFARALNFCPLEPTAEGPELQYLVVVLHTDQMVYAMQPTLPDAGFPPGVVAHPQLQFSVRGTQLVQ